MGDRDPIKYKGKTMHFKGSVNTIETFKYLKLKNYFFGREEVVIAGSMGGAIAAMHWADTLKSYTDSPVRILADAAIHLNALDVKTNTTKL